MTTGGNIVIPNAGNIGSASDTDAIAISSSGVVTLSQIPVFSLGLGATSFNDQNITNVGSISLDSIASDAGSTITVTLGTDAGDNFIVGNNNAFVVEGDTDRVGIGTATPAVALDVGSETDAILVAKGTTAQRPTGAAGQFRYNTTLGKFEGYTTEWGEIGGGTSTNTFETDIFTGDGSDTTFTLSQAVDENNLFVFIDGVFQAQNSYSVSGTTLTFSTAPANSRVITVYSVVGAVAGGNFALATMTGDGSDTTLTLPFNPVNENNLSVYIDGVYQNKDTFSVSGSTLTFSEAPPNGTKVEAMIATQTSVNTATILQDADEDTKVQVEESSDEDKIRFDTAGSERMVIDNSGNVIIGNSNALGLLTIKAPSSDDQDLITISEDGTNQAFSINSNFAGSGSANNNITLDSYWTNDIISFIGDGNVGIGTANPQVNFVVGDGTNGTGLEVTPNESSGYVNMNAYDRGSSAWRTMNIGGDVVTLNTGGTERMRITSNGAIKMPSSVFSQTDKYNLFTNDQGGEFVQILEHQNTSTADGNGPNGMQISFTGATPNQTNRYFFRCGDATALRIIIDSQGNITNQNNSYGSISDEKLKENIVDASPKLDELMKIQIKNFNFKGDDKKNLGVIAQQVETIFPKLIDERKDTHPTTNEDLGTTTKSVKHSVFVPMLIKAMQEQQTIIDDLKSRIETLENA